MNNVEWVEQTGNKWMPNKTGDELIGVVIAKKEGVHGTEYSIQNGKDEVFITPGHKVLQNRMTRVKIADVVRLVFQGEKPSEEEGKHATKLYTVYIQKK